jgi:hypothetical protein
MYFFVLALPGRFGEWCDAVTARLAERMLGPIEIMSANTLGEMALNIMRSGASQAVISSRQPGGLMGAALLEAGRNFVVAIDDPRLALADLVLGHGLPLAAAVQQVASSCAAIANYVAVPGAMKLTRVWGGDQPWMLTGTIAGHLGMTLDEAVIGKAVEDLAATGLAPDQGTDLGWWDRLRDDERRLAEGAVAPFVSYLTSGNLPPLIWERELFFVGETGAERAAGTVDITGRARCLLHGPYVTVPPGAWSLTLRLRLSREAADHEFQVEVVADSQLASGTLRREGEGPVEAHLAFEVDGLADHPLSIRLSTQRAAFDGAVTLINATLVRAALDSSSL